MKAERSPMQALAHSIGIYLKVIPPYWPGTACWQTGRYIMLNYGEPGGQTFTLKRAQAEAYLAKLRTGLQFRHTAPEILNA